MTFAIEKNIIWSPNEYAEAAVLAGEAGEEMLSRLDWMTLKPSVILDVGCGTGELTKKLQEKYQAAEIIALDHSSAMLNYAKQTLSVTSINPIHSQNLLNFIFADAAALPLPNQSVDLLFANFLFPWYDNIEILLREWRRVLRPQGLIMFTAFGPDTLSQFQSRTNLQLIPTMVDMHEIGDKMLQLGFADPVLDVNHYTLTYRDQKQMLQELYSTGMLKSYNQSHVDLNIEATCANTGEAVYQTTYEIIFVHAFLPAERDEISASEDGIVRVPLSHLRKRLR